MADNLDINPIDLVPLETQMLQPVLAHAQDILIDDIPELIVVCIIQMHMA